MLGSCSPKYLSYQQNYTFRSVDGSADYADLDYWAAHPWKWDPSDSTPYPLRNIQKDSTVDVFFLHPTSYTKKKKGSNANIDDPLINAKTDYTSILYQASVFNEACRVFAPRYRQSHLKNFFEKEEGSKNAAFDTAYHDIKNAFEYYLKTWNKGRPFIIAGHSQGSMLAERLLKEFFEGPASDPNLYNRLVAVYIPGWPVPKNYFSKLKMCEDSFQTGCICSWRTLKRNFIPFYMKKDIGNTYATNPITWTTGNEYAPRRLNKGSVLKNFNRIMLYTTDAQVENGFLFVKKPKFPGSFLFIKRNYHIGDINLYYMNMRENMKRRVAMFWKK